MKNSFKKKQYIVSEWFTFNSKQELISGGFTR